MFYVMDNEKLALFDDSKAIIENTIAFTPQLAGNRLLETDIVTMEEIQQYPNKVIVGDIEIEVDVPDYETVTEEFEEPIYSEDGEIIGYETKTYEKTIQTGSHKEIITVKGLVLNPDFEAEEAQKEAERIGKLECTKRVFVLMLEQLGVSYFTQIKPLIESNPQAQLEWELCVKLERSNPLLDIMAGQLGVTSQQLDGLFKYANGEITLEEFKGFAPVEASESNTGVEADGE